MDNFEAFVDVDRLGCMVAVVVAEILNTAVVEMAGSAEGMVTGRKTVVGLDLK